MACTTCKQKREIKKEIIKSTEFVNKGKILYSEKTNEIAIVNWVKHNLSISHSVLKCIETDLYEVKDKDLVRALYKDDYIQLLKSVPEATKTPNGRCQLASFSMRFSGLKSFKLGRISPI